MLVYRIRMNTTSEQHSRAQLRQKRGDMPWRVQLEQTTKLRKKSLGILLFNNFKGEFGHPFSGKA